MTGGTEVMLGHTGTRYGLVPCTVCRVFVPLTGVTSPLMHADLDLARSMDVGGTGLLVADETIYRIPASPSHHGTVPL